MPRLLAQRRSQPIILDFVEISLNHSESSRLGMSDDLGHLEKKEPNLSRLVTNLV